jgi:DNA modification methylase
VAYDGSVKVLDQTEGDGWQLWNGDSTEIMNGIPDNSVHFAVWSPPFASLYTFSDSTRDVSNNQDDAVFWAHYRYILEGVYRILKPGRLVSIHCMDLPTSITRDGFIGMRDFPGENIRLCQEVGFIYHSRVCIRKDPVSAMQRTKAIGLLHKQMVKDSALSRMAIADYIVTLRKPGNNDEPVSGIFETYYGDDMTDAEFTAEAKRNYQTDGERTFEQHKSIMIWQRYAEPIWMDIVQGDVLSHRVAREEADERHISPLQLTAVRRCVHTWTNPGDIVFSPFSGIGTAGYVAIEMGRRFVGAELKPSYWRQAVDNLRLAERERGRADLFGPVAPL